MKIMGSISCCLWICFTSKYRWLARRDRIPFRQAIHQVLLSTATSVPQIPHLAMEACIISVSAAEIAGFFLILHGILGYSTLQVFLLYTTVPILEKTPRVLLVSWSPLQRKSSKKMGHAMQISSLQPLLLLQLWHLQTSSSSLQLIWTSITLNPLISIHCRIKWDCLNSKPFHSFYFLY